MRVNFKIVLVAAFAAMSSLLFSQTNSLEITPEKEKNFTPYMYFKHGGPEGVAEFKAKDKHGYLKELWYYSESFYVKRNYLNQGVVLNEAIIDISRFESSRKLDEETIVVLPGFKDALVLLPLNQLIYKP